MLELIDEIGKKHIATLKALSAARRDDRLGPFAEHSFGIGPFHHGPVYRVGCLVMQGGPFPSLPKVIPIEKVETRVFVDADTVVAAEVDLSSCSPSHVLVLDNNTLAGLKSLSLVEYAKRMDVYGNATDAGGPTQGSVAQISVAPRGRLLLERKMFVLLCCWLLPLRMRRRALAVAAVVSTLNLFSVQLSWCLLLGGAIFSTLMWHYGHWGWKFCTDLKTRQYVWRWARRKQVAKNLGNLRVHFPFTELKELDQQGFPVPFNPYNKVVQNGRIVGKAYLPPI